MCSPPGVEFLVGLFGSLYAGLVAVPAYPPRAHKPDSRLTSIAASCRPGILATEALVATADDFAKHNPSLAGIPWLNEPDIEGAGRWERLYRDRSARPRLAILPFCNTRLARQVIPRE